MLQTEAKLGATIPRSGEMLTRKVELIFYSSHTSNGVYVDRESAHCGKDDERMTESTRKPRSVRIAEDRPKTTWQSSGFVKRPYCESGECYWLGPYEPGTLEVDHRDGDRRNNALDNLWTLCRNCHGRKTKRAGEGRPRHERGLERPPVKKASKAELSTGLGWNGKPRRHTGSGWKTGRQGNRATW